MQIDDPNESDSSKIWRAIRGLQAQAGLGKSSVTDGQTQFIGEESVLVSGSGRVSGTWTIEGPAGRLVISGDVDGSNGTFRWTGAEFHEGDESHKGKITNEGDIENTGTTTQKGNFLVKDGGTIGVEGAEGANLTIGVHPVTGRAAIRFSGGDLSSDGDQVALSSGNAFVGAGDGKAILGSTAGKAIVVTDDNIYFLGLPKKPASGGGGTTPPSDPPIEA